MKFKQLAILFILIIFTIPLIAIKYAPVKQTSPVRKPSVILPKPDFKNPHASFSPNDERPHPSTSKDYFEWWYYDAIFDDGAAATISFSASQILYGDKLSAIKINLLDTAGQNYFSYHTYASNSFVFEKPGNITLDASSVKWLKNGTVQIIGFGKTTKGEPLSINLIYTPYMPGLKIGDGEIRVDRKVALGWSIPIPRAKVEGVISIANNKKNVRGNGYHDHNWGEINLLDTFDSWYWTRIISPDTTLLYSSLTFRKELDVPTMQLIALGNTKRFMTVDDHIRQFQPQNITTFQDLIIKSDTLDLKISGLKSLLALNQSFPNHATNSTYVRQLCGYQLTTRLENLPRSSSGQCLSEFMYLNQK